MQQVRIVVSRQAEQPPLRLPYLRVAENIGQGFDRGLSPCRLGSLKQARRLGRWKDRFAGQRMKPQCRVRIFIPRLLSRSTRVRGLESRVFSDRRRKGFSLQRGAAAVVDSFQASRIRIKMSRSLSPFTWP